MAGQQKKKSGNIKVTQTNTFQSPDIYICLILFFFSFLLYFNTLGHGFVLDDPLSIELNNNVTKGLSGIGDIIFGGYRENNFGGHLYRPVSLIQFAIEWSISPANPFIHHLFSILWYSLSVVMVFVVTRRWFERNNFLFPLAVALIFAAHPLHTEVVANIKSRDEIMSLLFILLAFLSWHHYMKDNKAVFSIGAMVLFFLALVSKESAATMFPVFGMITYFIYNQSAVSSIRKGSLFLIPLIMLLIIRGIIFGDSQVVPVDIMDNPIVSAQGYGQHLATSLTILGKYFGLLIFPWPLSSDYSYTVIPVTGFGEVKVWISLIVHAGILAYAISVWKTKSFVSLSIFSYLLAISLYSQIPLVIGTMFGERLAFLPSFWFISGLVFVIFEIFKSEKEAIISNLSDIKGRNMFTAGIFCIICLPYSFITIERNRDWKDNLSLFTADSETYPQSVRLHNGVSEQLVQAASQPGLDTASVNTMLAKAEDHCLQILKIRPVATAYLTLGNIRLRQRRYNEALTYYDQVNDLKSIVDANKALAYREMGRNAGQTEQNIPKSQELLSKAIQLNDKDAETWFLLGVSFGVQGNHQMAAENFEKAFKLNSSPEYAKSAMMAFQNLGNSAKVSEYQKYVK